MADWFVPARERECLPARVTLGAHRINESAGAQNKSAKVDYGALSRGASRGACRGGRSHLARPPAAPGWKLVSVESSQGGIGTLTINAPPINIMTGALLMEICGLKTVGWVGVSSS